MTLPEAVSNRLIGALFVERGLVSQSQLVVALELQQETGQQLGQILVERFGVERAELAKVVAEHWARMGEAKEEAGTRASESWRQLGEILVSRGFVTREQLVQALERQRQTGERLGEALVGQGVISKFELAGSLAEQASLAEGQDEDEGKPAEVVELGPRLAAVLGPDSEPGPGPGLVPAAALRPEPAYGTPAMEAPEPEAAPQPEEAPYVEVALQPEAPRIAASLQAEEKAEPETAYGSTPGTEAPEPEAAPQLEEASYVEVALQPEEAPGHEPFAALCVAFASTPHGYRLVELDNGLVPEVGTRVEVPDVGELVVLRHGPSPLPADERVCVFLEPLVPAGHPA
jgi:hypothetical protein